MIPYRKILFSLTIGCTVLFLFIGCGVSQKQLDDAESRVKALEAQGVPDSLLSSAKVFLFQAKNAKKSSQSAYAKKYADSLFIYLEKAEGVTESTMQKLKPEVEALRKSINERKSQISRLQLEYADSLIAIIDSFANRGWLIQAKAKAVFLDTNFATLVEDEKKMKKIRPRLVGSWYGTRVAMKGFKGKETRRFTFKKDGTFNAAEEMNGQTSPTLKEYWKFLTWGKWDLRGDTVLMYVEREKCPKQHFIALVNKGGKTIWKKNQAPTYDSTVTNGKKDRFVTYEYMLEFFKKK